jgi:tetratricopeptide (TPR) repeat protein
MANEHVRDGTSTSQPTPTALGARRFHLRPAVPDFAGRNYEIGQMVERLRREGGPVGVSVRGMGGVGKTMLARTVAHAVADHFPDARFELNLRGTLETPLTASEALGAVFHAFYPNENLPDEFEDQVWRYSEVLQGKRALILLDDAKDEAQVKHLLEVPRSVRFIITSRNILALGGVESIPLGMLPPDEALNLLRKITMEKGTDEELRTVAELCGRLPLALRVAGDFLQLHDWPLPKYVAALQDESRRLARLERKIGDRDVEAVLALSARELIRDNAERAARWQMLSVFPTDFNTQAAAAVWDLTTDNTRNPDDADVELTALLERSLVQSVGDGNRYSLHDLMRPVARGAFKYVEQHAQGASSSDRLETAELRFSTHYHQVLGAASSLYEKGHDNVLRGLALFDAEQVNIRRGQQWAADNRIGSNLAAELSRDYALTGIEVIAVRLSAREQIAWLELAVEACRQFGDRAGEAKALGNQGVARSALGDARRAIGLLEQSLSICKEIGNRAGEGRALVGLGNAHVALGGASKAIDCHEQSLVIFREIKDRAWEGRALGNLGKAHSALGNARMAINFYEQRLSIACEIGDSAGEGHTCWNMALVYMELDRRNAIMYGERTLACFELIGHWRVDAYRKTLAEWRAVESQLKIAQSDTKGVQPLVPAELTALPPVEQDSRGGVSHIDSAKDNQILAWFEAVGFGPYLTQLQLFWCVGYVERKAIESAGPTLALARLNAELRRLKPHFYFNPLPINAHYLSECFDDVDGCFDKEPFHTQAWSDEERRLRLRVELNKRGDSRWTPKSRKALWYVHRFLTITEQLPDITVADNDS